MTISMISAPALAGKGGNAAPTACAATDITAPSATVIACSGFVAGNLLNQSSAGTDQQILAALGYSGWNGKIADVAGSVSGLNGNQTVDFGIALTGISIVAVHYGGGKGGPGQQSTAFYVLDAAQGIHQIHLAYGASSNAALFVTGLPRQIPDVPEPATWAAMVAGFGLVGAQMRRRARIRVRA